MRSSIWSNAQKETLTGFPIERNEVFSSLTAAASIVKNRNLNPMLILEEDAIKDFPERRSVELDSVLVGLAPDKFNYVTMTEAFQLIKTKKAPLLAVNKSRYIMGSQGLRLGPGCFVAGLEYSSGVQAECVGKPEETFFSAALDHMNKLFGSNISKEDTVMIGDDVKDDVVGAQACNFQGCLVKTGKYSPGDEEVLTPLKPDHLFPSIAEAIKVFTSE